MSTGQSNRIVVIGAGPAGLAAARELAVHGVSTTVVDRNKRPGGLARTEWVGPLGFDVGPHRFFTKSAEVLNLWREVLGPDLLEVDRLTRILYRGKFFNYPLKPLQALIKLGPLTSLSAMASYVWARFTRSAVEPKTFEEWVSREFGPVLFRIFFKSYTEKVWGVPCSQIGKEWAGQRIKGLNLAAAIRNALGHGSSEIRSLVEVFLYPRRGAGHLYESMAAELRATGTNLLLGSTVTKIHHEQGRVTSITTNDGNHISLEHLFSSSPITKFVEALVPPPPESVSTAASRLTYRAHITVNCVLAGSSPFPDNWIYIHSPDVKMARVANYRSFSESMSPDSDRTPISVEYFCFENDDLWNRSDESLGALAVTELEKTGLCAPESVLSTFVVREPDSYPTYYLGHQQHFDILYDFIDRFQNVTMMGRAGIYRYNNQDHSLLTGIYAARNHLGLTDVDLRSINGEDEYLERVAVPK